MSKQEELTISVKGTDKELYTDSELEIFFDYYEKECKGQNVVEAFLGYWWDSYKPCRRCSVCGKLMREGYCVSAGEAYYCSDECLSSEFTEEEWANQYEEDDQSYYTEWY